MRTKSIKNKISLIVIACTLILIGILGSYAFFLGHVSQNKNQDIIAENGTMDNPFEVL